MKPILKWAGGKVRLAAQIADVFATPCEGTYYEPFLGSAAVFFHLKASGRIGEAVLSDANSKLIEVHRAVRDEVDDVLEALSALPSDDWKERYYDVREAYNAGPWVGPRHAARFLWLNRAGYNGLYRENRSGRFNVPVGRYARLSFPAPERFYGASALLQGTQLECSDFRSLLDRVQEDDHVYCDPPYVPLSKTASFTGYCAAPFELAEQKALAEGARRAAFRGARIVLSNHDLPVVRNVLYPEASGFEHVARPRIRRAISRAHRARVTEVIAAIGPLERAA